MIQLDVASSSAIEPIRRLLESDLPGVLSVIVGTEGPSYRPIGAMMAIFDDGQRAGSLSSGCVEADISHHAKDALTGGRPVSVRYGLGSPYIDIQLPCGGGLDIALIPNPDRAVLTEVAERHARREVTVLSIDLETGEMSIEPDGETGHTDGRFLVRLEPEIFFYVFGKGPEAVTFGGLVQSAGFPNLLLSPDEETLAQAQAAGSGTRHLTTKKFPADLEPDRFSAVVLFFHDHEWEPPIIETALSSQAFYIGAQGSQRAANQRLASLSAIGIGEELRSRVRGPIGMIPSARDARKLAVGVLAEILAMR